MILKIVIYDVTMVVMMADLMDVTVVKMAVKKVDVLVCLKVVMMVHC